jgi:ABC-type protease/lipase transport system fused ATPase/permease subunit
LVVLDEPNSNLDAEGEEALTKAIIGVRERNGIVVVVAHRPNAIAGVDRLLMMNQGRVQVMGPKDEVLAKVLQRPTPLPRPLKVVPDSGSASA